MITNSDIVSLGELKNGSSFSSDVTTRLSKEAQYYVRSFLKTDKTTVYGSVVSFQSEGSNGPELISFEPNIGDLGDTITVVGKGFSSLKTENKVFFEGEVSEVIESNGDTVWVKVPESIDSDAKISVAVSGASSSFSKKFILNIPKINSLDGSTKVSFQEAVYINTPHIPTNTDFIKIKLVSDLGEEFTINNSYLVQKPFGFKIPVDIGFSRFRVKLIFNNQESLSQSSINLLPPVINSLSKSEIKYDDEITIFGENFGELIEKMTVWFGDTEVPIIEAKNILNGDDYIKVKVPSILDKTYSQRNLKLGLQVLGQTLNSNKEMQIINQWFRLKKLPFTENSIGWTNISAITTSDDRAYVMVIDELWMFDGTQWAFLSKFPISSVRVFPSINYHNGSIYYGLGRLYSKTLDQSDFWEYSIESNSWKRLNDLPGRKRSDVRSFVYDDKLYLGGGDQGIPGFSYGHKRLEDFWVFDSNLNSWAQLSDLPFYFHRNRYTVKGNELYGFNTSKRDFTKYEYDIFNDSWQQSSLSFTGFYTPDLSKLLFYDDKLITFSDRKEYGVYSLDLNTMKSERMEDPPFNSRSYFILNKKIYMLVSSDFVDAGEFWEFDIGR